MHSPLPLTPDANKPDALLPFKSIFFQYFEHLVDSCCMRLDLEFGLQFGKDRDKTSKDHYRNLLEYLRSVRGDIKRSYLLKISDNFDKIERKAAINTAHKIDMAAVSLSSDEFVKEDYSSTLIIKQCGLLFHEDLIRINKQLAILLGKSVITDRQNPVAPENLIRTLFEVVKPLKLNSDSRVAIYKAFEVNVFSQMGFIYRELIKHGEAAVIKLTAEQDKLKRITTPAEPISDEFRQLQSKLEHWRSHHAPPGYDLIPGNSDHCYEHFEIKNALQVLKQFSGEPGLNPQSGKPPLKSRLLKNLEQLNFSDEVKTLAKEDEDVLDLVSLIFSRITQDELLAGPVKTSLLQLEIPAAAACLGQYSVFADPDHPVRQLLDDAFAAGICVNPDTDAGRKILERMTGMINALSQNGGFDISGWTGHAMKFSQFLTRQRQESLLHEQNSKQLMLDKQALSFSKKTIAEIIDESIQNKELPAMIADFLRTAWQKVMLDAYLGKDQEPELWQKSVQAMNELIISAMPPADDKERRQILKFLPGLIKELRRGLKRISYDTQAQSSFFKDLVVLHILLMDNKEVKETRTDIGLRNPPADSQPEIKPEIAPDPFRKQVRDLTEDSWVVFISNAEKRWGKLAWKSLDHENMLFVDKNGEKIAEIGAHKLAEKLRLEQIAVVEFTDIPVTESVLSQLMNL